VPQVDDGYSSLARDVSEHHIYLTSQSLLHPERTVCCFATHCVVLDTNCSFRSLQAAAGSTIVTMYVVFACVPTHNPEHSQVAKDAHHLAGLLLLSPPQ
jgi:hypothetical protein